MNLGPAKVTTLIDASTTTLTGDKVYPWSRKKTFQAIGNTSAGAGASTIGIEVSNDGVNFIEVDVLSLTLGVAVTSDSYEMDSTWLYARAVVKTISGTNAQVTVYMGSNQ